MAPPSDPDNFPSQAAFDYLIHIEVGTEDDKRTFQVFKGVICFYSGYFTTSLNSNFVEAHSHIVSLPTEDPTLFDYFHHWLHTRTFFDSSLDPAVALDFLTLSQMWVFGDAHDIPMLQNEVTDILLRKMANSTKFFPNEAIVYVYDNMVEKSKLRRLVAQNLRNLLGWTLGWDERGLAKMDCDDVLDLAGALRFLDYEVKQRELVFGALQERVWRCWWYVHEDGVKCEMLRGKKFPRRASRAPVPTLLFAEAMLPTYSGL